MNKIWITLLLLVFTCVSYGQEDNLKHSLGFSAGVSTGIGLSYRYFPNKFGVQITALPLLSSTDIFSSTGISLLVSAYRSPKVNVYGYLGNHFLYTKEVYQDSYYNEYDEIADINKFYNIGLGGGVEFMAGKRIGFNFAAGYALKLYWGYDPDNEPWKTVFDATGGIFFKF